MTNAATSEPVVGLVAPLPPQVGGVASVSEWLLEHAGELDCRFETFDLERPPGDEAGGTLSVRAALRQVGLLFRFVGWLGRAPRLLHYAVALNPTGLARDTLFVLLARASGRKVIAHVHGADLHAIHNRSLRAKALRAIGRASVESVTIAPSLAAGLTDLGMPALSILNPIRARIATRGAGHPASSGSIQLLFVGTYGRRKGTPELIQALARARTDAVDAVLVLAGKEEHLGEEAELRKLVRDLGLETAVSFAGVLDRERLAALYAESSVFCLPSYREGLPMALLEAMAAGLPSITTAVGGIGDLVEHDVSGILVEPGDVEELASAIEKLASEEDLRRSLGDTARERIRAVAGDEVIAVRWRELYSKYLTT